MSEHTRAWKSKHSVGRLEGPVDLGGGGGVGRDK